MPELWSHQTQAIEYALSRCGGPVGIFAGMGSGKTRIAIEIIARHATPLALVVMPAALLDDGSWVRQFEEFLPARLSLVVLDRDKTPAKKLKALEGITAPAVVMVNYESAWRGSLGKRLLGIPWTHIILDEAHRIKAAGGRASRFFARFSKRHEAQRLALTGTPTPNSPLDAYGLYRFLDPSIFGTRFDEFASKYAVYGGYENRQVLHYKNLDDLSAKMASISLLIRTEDVLDLPVATDILRRATLEPEARVIYARLESEFLAEVGTSQVVLDNALVKLLRLQQVVSGFLPSPDGFVHEVSRAKQALLEDLLEDLDPKEPIVLFGKFLHDLQLLRAAAESGGRTVAEVSGAKHELATWKAGEADVLVVQVQAGSEGVDLTRAHYAVYFNKPWSYGLYQQSRARLVRPGQTRPVVFLHLLVRDTVDEALSRALKRKQGIIQNEVLRAYREMRG